MAYVNVRLSNGDAYRSGIETPEGTRLVKLTNTHFVLLIPGHTYWSGRGMPRPYAPAEYEVYRLEGTEPDITRPDILTLIGTNVVSFDVRSDKTQSFTPPTIN